MVEWAIGMGVLLGGTIVVLGVPAGLGWLFDKAANGQNSWGDRWAFGAVGIALFILCTLVAYGIGGIVLGVIGGG